MRDILELYISLFIAFQAPGAMDERLVALEQSFEFVVAEVSADSAGFKEKQESVIAKQEEVGEEVKLDEPEEEQIKVQIVEKEEDLLEDVVEDLPELEEESKVAEVQEEVNEEVNEAQPIYKPLAELEYSDLGLEPEEESLPKQQEESSLAKQEKPLNIEETDAEVAVSFANNVAEVAEVEDGVNNETDLFSLDKDEFKIEEIAAEEQKNAEKENRKYEIISDIKNKLLGRKKKKSAARKPAVNVASSKSEVVASETEISEEEKKELQLAETMTRLSRKMKIRKKSYDSYEREIQLGRFYRKQYEPANNHLSAITYQEEFYQMLFAAIKVGDLATINAITRKVGLVQNVTIGQRTALTYAMHADRLDSLRLLLRLGYNPNVRDGNQDMPLHVAVAKERLDFVTELVICGANPSVPNKDLKLPVTLALESQNLDIAGFLQNAGAEYGKLAKNFDKNIAR